MNNSVREGDAPPFFKTSFNLCREVVFLQRTIDLFRLCRGWKTHRRKSRLCRGWNLIQCLTNQRPELQFQLYYLRRGEISGIEIFLHSSIHLLKIEQQGSQKKRKVNSFESLCDLIISDKLFETLNKETATHIGIREAEDWFRPIDLAKECDIYISSKNGSHKETPITYGYTQDPFKNRSQNFKPKIKENYPQYLERENKNCFICGDSSHYARDCEKRFKPKESNDHIHNKTNVNTLKIESEKQNSDECSNLKYVNIFVENQPITALIDSGCQIPVLNSSLIRVQTPSEEIITFFHVLANSVW
ncbi:retrovirus-related Pol polyprotein from transposon 412 [Trichonephila clavipes]|nr:retrovirus-related Pol polyprotein from transposon 412 [Trichonephila clavipes]